MRLLVVFYSTSIFIHRTVIIYPLQFTLLENIHVKCTAGHFAAMYSKYGMYLRNGEFITSRIFSRKYGRLYHNDYPPRPIRDLHEKEADYGVCCC